MGGETGDCYVAVTKKSTAIWIENEFSEDPLEATEDTALAAYSANKVEQQLNMVCSSNWDYNRIPEELEWLVSSISEI